MNRNWQHQTHQRAAIIFGQMNAALACAPDDRAREDFLQQPNNPYFSLLNDLYGEDYPLARLLDLSDLVVHAEGPDLRDPMPALRATTWLCTVTNKQLRHLVLSTMDLAQGAKRMASQDINLRLTGLAPGSLYAGFTLLPNHDDILNAQTEPVYQDARLAMQGLSRVPKYIDDEQLSPDIADAFPDPAVRDASLVAAFNLSPTGKRGIHTLSLSVPGSPPAHLGQRERVVLRDALRKPHIVNGKFGRFVGEVRAADLDQTRFNLRTSFGTLRCIVTDLPDTLARQIFGRTVEVSGFYETDVNGIPRLMRVDTVHEMPISEQIDMPLRHTA